MWYHLLFAFVTLVNYGHSLVKGSLVDLPREQWSRYRLLEGGQGTCWQVQTTAGRQAGRTGWCREAGREDRSPAGMVWPTASRLEGSTVSLDSVHFTLIATTYTL